MKIMFKYLLNGYTGKADDLVLYYNRNLNKIIARRRPKVKITETHINFSIISKNMRNLNISPAYKEDFKVYADLYSRLKDNQWKPVTGWYNLFMKMMYAMAKADPENIDLKTVTRAQIETEALPCITVKDAVSAGLLPPVRICERLDNPI
jgi:hypothetical protein